MFKKPVKPISRDAIRKRNARFNALTPAAKRVTIAKDVIAALDAELITARARTYAEYRLHHKEWLDYEGRSVRDAQAEILNGNVCMRAIMENIIANNGLFKP